MQPELIDTATAALACGKGEWTVRAAVRAGKLTNHGAARAYRLDLDEVLEVLGDPLHLRA